MVTMYISAKQPDLLNYIMCLAIAFEEYFLEKSQNIVYTNILPKDEVIAQLESKYNITFGKAFTHMDKKYLKGAFDKIGTATIPAYSLAFMYGENQKLVRMLVKNDLVQLVSDISDLRGHGNNLQEGVTFELINKLRDKFIFIINIMEDYYEQQKQKK